MGRKSKGNMANESKNLDKWLTLDHYFMASPLEKLRSTPLPETALPKSFAEIALVASLKTKERAERVELADKAGDYLLTGQENLVSKCLDQHLYSLSSTSVSSTDSYSVVSSHSSTALQAMTPLIVSE